MSTQVATTAQASVGVLLCTLNGSRFLAEQLDSIAAQTHKSWFLVVSDDGSSDDTLQIIAAFARRVPQQVIVRNGPRLGVTENFLSLARDRALEADYFAFSDQDDIWTNDHLARALDVLARQASDRPALCGGRTRLISETGAEFGFSPLFRRPPGFRNAVMQSLAGGNTMVFNRAARDLLAAAPDAHPVSHDWWTYQLVSGAGGHVHYDPEPTVLYRQHDNNVAGSNLGWQARGHRMLMLFSGRFARWTDQNLAAFRKAEHLLTPDSRSVLGEIMLMRSEGLLGRLAAYRRSGIYRQTLAGSVALAIAVVFNCV